jgi:hypothetical protein
MSQSNQFSNEDEVTKRHLKFLMYLIETAAKDPEWQADLKEKAEQFGRIDN